MADVVLGLLAALLGAGAALGGQLIVRRREERERWTSLLLEDCATIYALEDRDIGALWEAFGERKDHGRLADWPAAERASAAARLTIVATDEKLIAAVDALRHNGRAMWHAARSGSQLDWDELLDHHRQLLDRFVATAKVAASNGRTI